MADLTAADREALGTAAKELAVRRSEYERYLVCCKIPDGPDAPGVPASRAFVASALAAVDAAIAVVQRLRGGEP